jgi:CRISPR-associated protein Csm2
MGRNRTTPQPQIDMPSTQEMRVIIQGDAVDSAQKTVEWAQRLAKALKAAELKSSQIRNVFGQVRQIEMSWPLGDEQSSYAEQAYRDLILLKPKLAYQAERVPAVVGLAEVLSAGIDLVNGNRVYFQRFVDFFEAILAYHKAEGGK